MVERERDSRGKFVHVEKISLEELRNLYTNKRVSGRKIAKMLGVSDCAVYSWLRKAGVQIEKHMEIIHPDLSPSEDLAYVLGALKGDGSVGHYGRSSYTIRLRTTTLTFNKSFESSLKRLGLHPRTRKCEPSKNHWGHKLMYETLAHSRAFYDWYQTLSVDDIEKMLLKHELGVHFVRGFYESEGSLKNRDDLAISNSDEELLKMVARRITDYGIEVGVGGPYFFTGSRNRKPMFLIQMGERKARKLIDLIKPCIRNQFKTDEPQGIEKARWTKNEVEILRSGLSIGELTVKLKNRTERAIRTKRQRLLQIV